MELFESITGLETIHEIRLKETKGGRDKKKKKKKRLRVVVNFMRWFNLHKRHMRRNSSRDPPKSTHPIVYEKLNQHVDDEYEKLNFSRDGFYIMFSNWLFPYERKVDFKNNQPFSLYIILLWNRGFHIHQIPTALPLLLIHLQKSICLLRFCLVLIHWCMMRVFLPQVLILIIVPWKMFVCSCCLAHPRVLRMEEERKAYAIDFRYKLRLFNICRVKVTPTRVYFSGPEPYESNRTMGKTVNVSGFPPEVNAMEVRQHFESITGSGTIHAIRLKKTKHGEKFYALVQFAQETHANKLLTQSTEVNTPYRLNFHEWKYEIDSKDKASMEHYIDGLLMHFGFLATPEKFKYLYSVGCSFGSGNQNLHFSAHLSEDYIGRISWHLSQEKDSKLLLIQLKGGPKIYENQNQHSSAIALKFPRELKVEFKNIVINSSLQNLICLLRSCSIMRVFLPQVLILLFISFLIPKHLIDRAFIDYALPKLLSLGKCLYDHIAWLTKEYLEWGKKEKPTESTLDYQHGLFDIRRDKITPTRVYFSGPKPHESNRVLREYAKHINNFIIVSFVDENLWFLYLSLSLSGFSSVVECFCFLKLFFLFNRH
ncbi:LOW QUALITY PROTEIN: hypothetical protein HID58_044189 [Brassica napus]|uniref:RNA-dependent RNA polymerase n=1 Tax=Brassica napus TaxID=3708 RepID=A0ABQ8BKK2_BRANA|nr:LOW QUALITY PROTEIN: hypothetical protein HID58_044189 [Brassica napus]